MSESGTPAQSVTQLLRKWSEGDKAALDQLMPIVYDELRRLAGRYLRRKGGGQSLQPTALVHEAYVMLAAQINTHWDSRAQFYGLAAKIMRDILVDHARSRMAVKRGGGQLRVSLDQADRLGGEPAVEILALDALLNELSAVYPQPARVVELRFFGGLTIEETAEVMGTSHATVERQWSFARAWLRRELSKSN
jgi:RNA polymerase sigma factor (TIGR02999 family)